MSLYDLPDELLDHIIGLTVPEGIESFALSCKTIYNIAEPQITQHNTYKRRWKHFAYADFQLPEPGPTLRPQTALQLIHAIALDPLIAQYIESARLWVDPSKIYRHRNLLSTAQSRFEQDEASLTAIRRLLRDSRYLKAANQDPDLWLRRIQLDDKFADEAPTNFATAFLLTLLPNVKALGLPQGWANLPRPEEDYRAGQLDATQDIWPVLNAITRAANGATSRNTALAKLERILPYANKGYDQRNALQELEPFFTAPSIKEVYACNCVAVDDGYTGILFSWRHSDLVSSLRKVELVACCIDSDGITELIKHTPQLKCLRYSHATKWHGCQFDWDAGAFVAAIGMHLGGSLTEFAVTIDCLYGDVETGVTSMHDFTCLRNVELDVSLFCAPSIDSGERLGMSSTQGTTWEASKIPCLADILPQSVKSVDLFAGGKENVDHTAALRSLFSQSLDKQRSMLPKLERLAVRCSPAQYETLNTDLSRTDNWMACELVNAVCTVAVAPAPSRRPLWEEDFHSSFGPLTG